MNLPVAVLSLALAAEAPTPPPTPEEFTIYNVTPGISGFIAFFVMALVGWLLFRSLVRHVRKVDMAAAQRQREEEEADGGAGADGAASVGEPAEAEGAATVAEDRRGQAAE